MSLNGTPRSLLRKKIALVAHDRRKRDLLEWARFNVGTLRQHDLVATETTSGMLIEELGLVLRPSRVDQGTCAGASDLIYSYG
jgi:methylglyoxal synthase